MFDAYAVLGVRHDATTEEIEAAYRALIKATHPDLAHDEPERERRTKLAPEINAARGILTSPARRARHDLELAKAGLGEADPARGDAAWTSDAPPAPPQRSPRSPRTDTADGRPAKRARSIRTTPERERQRAIRQAEAQLRRAARGQPGDAGRSTGSSNSTASDGLGHEHRHGDRRTLRGLFDYAMKDRDGQRMSNAIVAGTAAFGVLFGVGVSASLLILIVAGFLGLQLAISHRRCHTPAADLMTAATKAVQWFRDAHHDIRGSFGRS